MRKIFVFITAFIAINYCFGQTIKRHFEEDKDNLVNRIIDKNSFIIGQTYELKDSSSTVILYFEIKPLKSLPRKVKPFEPFSGIPTLTLFNILYSKDRVNYIKSIVDTIDFNSGCCPCHFPATVDSIFLNISESQSDLIVLQTNPVRHDCNSMTSYWALLYEDFLRKISLDDYSIKPNFTVGYYPFAKNKKAEILKQFKEKRTKK